MLVVDRNQLEVNIEMNSSKKRSHQILGVIEAKRAERLLLFLANAIRKPRHEVDNRIWEKFLADYPDVFGPVKTLNEQGFRWRMETFANGLRRAWDAPDARHREWFLFVLRQTYHESVTRQEWTKEERDQMRRASLSTMTKEELQVLSIDPSPHDPEKVRSLIERGRREFAKLDEVPEVTPMEAALFHLQQIGDRARHCPNPECPAPYFIATKKGQKYCSPECAAPSQRESKRKWWHENRAKGGA